MLMKNIFLKNIFNSQQVISFLVFLIAITTIFGCKKNATEFSTDLAINRRIIKVAATEGSTRVLVFADGDWSAKTIGDASWVTLDKASSSGKGEFLASFTNNEVELPRAVLIVISANNKTDTISLQQRGIVPVLNILDANANGIAGGGAMKTAITTNIPFNLMSHVEVYDASSTGWITNLAITGTNLTFSLDKNPSPVARQAVLRLSYLDALGTTTKDSLIITQNPKGEYDLAALKDFDYVKSLAAGVNNEDIFIEGVIISDKGNPNMGLNANSAANKHVVDKTENSITAYIQSLDGKSGFRIRTKTGGDNIFGRNQIVKIWLKGVTIKKETTPTRVTLEQVQSINVISKMDATTELMPREIYMKDLIDNDTYTYVKLKQVEISIPDGSFFNINEGYLARTDAYPLNIRDVNGNSMYMITNLDVPYRRDGNLVPQGSGSISGILVHEDLARYGTNIGKFAIRHLSRTDIDLKTSRDDGFSNVLVEWSRYKTENSSGATDAKNPLTPDIGSGVLTQSMDAPLDFSTNGIYAGPDYNGLLIESTTVKGIIANGAWASKKWWNDAKNIGASWNITVSTIGITRPISMQADVSSEMGGPTNFIAEWSTTGTDVGTWNLLGEYTCQDVVIYANTLLTQVPGFKTVNFEFPIGASNLNTLFIRLRVKNKTTGTATSQTGGTLTAAGISRMGHFSIKYNK